MYYSYVFLHQSRGFCNQPYSILIISQSPIHSWCLYTDHSRFRSHCSVYSFFSLFCSAFVGRRLRLILLSFSKRWLGPHSMRFVLHSSVAGKVWNGLNACMNCVRVIVDENKFQVVSQVNDKAYLNAPVLLYFLGSMHHSYCFWFLANQ